MADRRVRVILEAVTASFSQGMARARTETTGLAQAASKNSAEFTRLGLAMAAAGAAIGLGLRKAAREAVQFESALTKSVTLIGVSKAEMQGMGDAALRMSDTGKGPLELADALFFVQSAGLRGSAAMDVLESSAKASAIGLGETKVVADLVTSAMNAYGSDVLSAADATDILVGSVREGKAEAPELAGAMGKVLPIASEMGVRFDEVGAAVAAMTRTGTDAATATTQLRAFLQGLINPARGSEEALRGIGLSAAQLRDTIQRDGLFAAMMRLKEAIGDNDEVLGKILPNQRALLGFLDLTGANAEENAGIFERMTDTMGLTADAHEEWSKTSEAAIARFSAAAESARISAMEGLAKPLTFVLDIGTRLMQMYTELPAPVRAAGTAFLTASAAVLTLGGGFLALLPRIVATKAALAAMPPVVGRSIGLLGKAGLAGAILGVTVVAFDQLTKSTRFANVVMGEFRNELLKLQRTGDVSETIEEARGALERFDDTVEILGVRMELWGGSGSPFVGGTQATKDLAAAIELLDSATAGLISGGDIDNMGQAVTFVADSLDTSRDRAKEFIEDMPLVRDALANVGSQAGTTEVDLEDLGDEFTEVAEETNEAADALDAYLAALRAATDPVFAMQSRVSEYQEAQDNLNEAIEEFGEDSDEAKEAQWGLFEAASALFAEVQSGALSFDEAASAIDAMRDAGLLTEAQASDLKAEVAELTETAEGYEGDYMAELKAELDRQALTDAEKDLERTARMRNPEYRAHLNEMAMRQGGQRLDDLADTRIPSYKPQVNQSSSSKVSSWLDRLASNRNPTYKPQVNQGARDSVSGSLGVLAQSRSVAFVPYLTRSSLQVSVTGRATGITAFGHTGGMVTSHGILPRMHDGGVTQRFHNGSDRLRSDEVPAILQTGERVLSRDQTGVFDRLMRMMGNTQSAGPSFHNGGVASGSGGGPTKLELVVTGSGALYEQINYGLNRGQINIRAEAIRR